MTRGRGSLDSRSLKENMRMKARIALLASLVSLSLVAAVSAQVSTVEGTVVANSGGALVIDTASGQRTFMVDAQSSLPADLAAGTRVKVEYHTLANDKLHAFKVSSLGAAPVEPAPAPVATAPAVTAPAPAMQERTPPATTTTTATTTGETASTATPTTTETERRLPATASPLPLLALAGGPAR
jgi:hypothetical protein